MFELFFNTVFPEPVRQAWGLVFDFAPLWLPVILGYAFWRSWRAYARIWNYLNTEHMLLEIRLPAEITQSPAAMEVVLDKLYHTGEGDNRFDELYNGASRPWFSLEIVSLEGEIHFYIWGRKKFRELLESVIYAQFPGVEVDEVPDYTTRIPFDLERMGMFAMGQKKAKPDPYPIKTYVDFGLHQEQKEEFKIEPIAGLLEFMGSIGKGEYLWLQMVVRSHIGDDKHKPGTFFGTWNWTEEAEAEVKKILEKYAKPNQNGESNYMALPKGEQNIIEAIQRNVAKKPYDVGMRFMYLAENEHYNKNRHAGLPTVFRTFETHHLNGLKPIFLHGFDYWWQDPFGWRVQNIKRKTYNAYVWRSFFHPPYKMPHFVLSSEELATIYHLPGRAVTTPGLPRITSRREEAPSNLPM